MKWRAFRVGGRLVRPDLAEIEGAEGPNRVELRSIQVLQDLAKHAGQVRSREEILESVWGDTFVTEEVLTHAIWDLRRAFGDDARRPQFIQTLPRRGYRLVCAVAPCEEEQTGSPDLSVESLPEEAKAGAPVEVSRSYATAPAVLAQVDRPAKRGRRAWTWIGALVVFGALAWGLVWGVLSFQAPQIPRRIAVLQTVLEAPEGKAPFVATAVTTNVLSTLAAYRDLAALEPSGLGEDWSTPLEAARANAADEVLVSTCQLLSAGLARVQIRRIAADDGRVLWADSFEVPVDLAASRVLAKTVQLRLREAFPDLKPRSGSPDLDVRMEDYELFLDVRHGLAAGEGLREPALSTLEQVARSSPRFLDGLLAGANLALRLFQDSRAPALRQRALTLLERAEELAPDDSRPLLVRCRLELASGDLVGAGSTLQRIEELAPNSLEILSLRAELLERQGDSEEALALRHRLVDLSPSWQNLYQVAKIEHRRGNLEEARALLRQLLERAPENRWGLALSAEIELLSGEPAAAERRYRALSLRFPERRYSSNLGTAQLLQRDLAGARESYRQALDLAPQHPLALTNLAEVEANLGHHEEARELCQRTLTALSELENEGDLRIEDRLLKSHCLARLGQRQAAVATVLDALQEAPRDSEVRYLSAMVFTLVGDHVAALANMEQALELGVNPRWFKTPSFDTLWLKEGAPAAFRAEKTAAATAPSAGT